MPARTFHEFERAGWEGAAREYDDAFGRLTRQAIAPLLDAAGVRAGVRTLDVASGPGYVAAAAASRGAHVTGVDFSAAMVRLARSSHAAIEFREGDASDLDFPDGSFDAVTMNFGVLHLAHPERALAEAFRVLRPGGRYAFTAWAKPGEAAGFGIVLDAVREHGDPGVMLPPGPPFFRFSDAAECRKTLRAAGFTRATVRKIPQSWRFESADALFEAYLAGTVRTQALLKAQTAAKLEAIRAAVRKAVSRYARRGAIAVPMPAVLASAGRPAR